MRQTGGGSNNADAIRKRKTVAMKVVLALVIRVGGLANVGGGMGRGRGGRYCNKSDVNLGIDGRSLAKWLEEGSRAPVFVEVNANPQTDFGSDPRSQDSWVPFLVLPCICCVSLSSPWFTSPPV